MKIKHFVIFITFRLFWSCSETPKHIHRIEGTQLNVNDSLSENQQIEDFVKPYRDHIDKDLAKVLAHNPSTLTKTDTPYNTALGNLMADAVYQMTNPIYKNRTGREIDFVILNNGGIRSSLPKGDVTTRSAFELMPFENMVVVVEISGDRMQELAQYLIKGKTAHPLSNQFQLHFNKDESISTFTVKGKPIIAEQTYHIATTDYLMNGGDHMNFFSNPVSVTETDYLLRNLLIDYFTAIDTISAVSDNRFGPNN